MKNPLKPFILITLLLFTAASKAGTFDCTLVAPAKDAPLITFTVGFNESDTRFLYVQCILNRALHRLGYRAELLAGPVGRELFDVVEGRADAIAATTAQKMWPIEVDNLIRLESSFVEVTNVVFTRKGVPTPSTWQELAESGLRIVMARHHTSAQAYLAKANTLDVEGVDQAVQVFLAGRADALVSFEANEEIQMRKELSTADINPAETLSVSPLYTFVNKRFEAIVPAMNEAIQAEIAVHLWNFHDK